jgi:hypothetical protein
MPRARPAAPTCAPWIALLAVLATGCITRPVKQEVFDQDGIQVFLRSEVRWTTPIDQGYSHPVTIAPVRMAHILSRIDLRPPKGAPISFSDNPDRAGAIPTDMLYPMGEAISKALSLATPEQEVVVMAIRDTKRFGIFDHDFLTSFVLYARDERLYFHLSRYDWEIPKRQEERIPEPQVGDHAQSFKLFAGTAMALVSDQSLAIDWRDAIFARPTRTRVLPSGKVVRSEILMESPPEVDELEDPLLTMPDDLSPQQLRDLADIEEARREGRITEVEYRTQRRAILEADEAAPSPSPQTSEPPSAPSTPEPTP